MLPGMARRRRGVGRESQGHSFTCPSVSLLPNEWENQDDQFGPAGSCFATDEPFTPPMLVLSRAAALRASMDSVDPSIQPSLNDSTIIAIAQRPPSSCRMFVPGGGR